MIAGGTFAGSFTRWDRRNVSFKLRYTEERRLKGRWVMEAAGNSGPTGAWSLARIGPGPPAPRQR